ncbi:DUF1963 domain-containing protein [Streptomyces althioticus]|uniref:DUF1963 domain-containing protein n=1 Tax=Streptomyces althioticus TaxID=83380 RepID=UPI0037A9F01D
MSYTDEFRAFACEHGVSDEAITRIMWCMQPSVHLDMVDPAAVGPHDIVVGHTGGLPELPTGVPWEGGEVYVAGLDLAAIPEQPLSLNLPREGHLLFFTNVGYEDDESAPVVYVPPGTETTVRPAPAGVSVIAPYNTWTTQVLKRRTLVYRPGTSWDPLGWTWAPEHQYDHPRALMPDLDDVHEDDRETLRPLLEAITEYAEQVGSIPFVHRTCTLRGELLSPRDYWCQYGREFLEQCEEAVVTLRDTPERFDELYAEGLEKAWWKEGGPWLNLLEFGESELLDTGDGEVSWIIRREDLLAQRFDRVMQSYYC